MSFMVGAIKYPEVTDATHTSAVFYYPLLLLKLALLSSTLLYCTLLPFSSPAMIKESNTLRNEHVSHFRKRKKKEKKKQNSHIFTI